MKPLEQDYQKLSDEALCVQVASGDRLAEETLVIRYNRLVRMCARPLFLAGGDSEDLIQEGMVGYPGLCPVQGRVIPYLCGDLHKEPSPVCGKGGIQRQAHAAEQLYLIRNPFL